MNKILREIVLNRSEVHPTGTCVCCGEEVTAIDIATQAIQQSGAGMYSCQRCLPIDLSWYEKVNQDGSITLK